MLNNFKAPLSNEETITLLKSNNKESFNKLIEHNLRLVSKITNRYYNLNKPRLTKSGDYSFDDLFQVGVIGLINAINNYDFDNKANFCTFASTCIRNEVAKYLRIDNKNKRTIYFESEYKKDYKNICLKDILTVTVKDYIEFDFINSRNNVLKNILLSLSDKEKKLVCLYYGFTKTGKCYEQKEIAAIVGINQSNVSHTLIRIRKKLMLLFLENDIINQTEECINYKRKLK